MPAPRVNPERLGEPRYLCNYAEVALLLGCTTGAVHKHTARRDFPEPDIVWDGQQLWAVETIRRYLSLEKSNA